MTKRLLRPDDLAVAERPRAPAEVAISRMHEVLGAELLDGIRARVATLDAEDLGDVWRSQHRPGREYLFGFSREVVKLRRELHTLAALLDRLEAAGDGSASPTGDPAEVDRQAANDLVRAYALFADGDVVAELGSLAREQIRLRGAQLEAIRSELTDASIAGSARYYLDRGDVPGLFATLTADHAAEMAVAEKVAGWRTAIERLPGHLATNVADAVTAAGGTSAIAAALAATAAPPDPTPLEDDPELRRLVETATGLEQKIRALAVTTDLGADKSEVKAFSRTLVEARAAITERSRILEQEREAAAALSQLWGDAVGQGEAFAAIVTAAASGNGEAVWELIRAAESRPDCFRPGFAGQIRKAISVALTSAGPVALAEILRGLPDNLPPFHQARTDHVPVAEKRTSATPVDPDQLVGVDYLAQTLAAARLPIETTRAAIPPAPDEHLREQQPRWKAGTVMAWLNSLQESNI